MLKDGNCISGTKLSIQKRLYLLDHTHTHTGVRKLSEGIVFEHFQSEQYCAKEIECVSRACIYGREGAIGKKIKGGCGRGIERGKLD